MIAALNFKERGLNKELLSGPDLTNQIVGVLSRFREHDVAFMAEIESTKLWYLKNTDVI